MDIDQETRDRIANHLAECENGQDTINNIAASTGIDIEMVCHCVEDNLYITADKGNLEFVDTELLNLEPDTVVMIDGE